MTLGAGILLSSIFLGCVLLYIKSDNKSKWRKIVLVLFVIFLIVLMIGIGYLIYVSYIKNSFTHSSSESSDKLSIIGITPGDKLSDIQFQMGKAKKEKEPFRGFTVYKTDYGVEIWAKDNIAEMVFYACQTSESTYIHKIKCGDTEDVILKTYKKDNVTVFCTDNVELRIYEVKNLPLSFVLQKNKVIYIGLYKDEQERMRPTNQKVCS
jgi:hypothetical protein